VRRDVPDFVSWVKKSPVRSTIAEYLDQGISLGFRQIAGLDRKSAIRRFGLESNFLDFNVSSPAHLNVGFQLLDGQTVEGGYGFIVLAVQFVWRIQCRRIGCQLFIVLRTRCTLFVSLLRGHG
jgi:hypothetical protein